MTSRFVAVRIFTFRRGATWCWTALGRAAARSRAGVSNGFVRLVMIRGFVAIVVLVLDVAVFGTALFVLGLAYPSRKAFALAARVWSRILLLAAGVRLRVEGAGRIADGVPRFFMANHQSALDIPILFVALRGDVRFLAKRSLFRLPIFGWVLSRYHFVSVDRRRARVTLGALEAMLARLRSNPVSFAVFPEGTRTRDGGLLPFRQGTMKVGQRSGLDIVPVTIQGATEVYHRDRPLEVRPGEVRVVISEPIPAEQAAAMSSAELHDRVVQTIAGELSDPDPNLNRDLDRARDRAPSSRVAASAGATVEAS